MIGASLQDILSSELQAATPFRVWTLSIFIAAIVHTLMANHFISLSERVAKEHAKREKGTVSFLAEVLHFLGEIEIVFALWVIPLVLVITAYFGWQDVLSYLNTRTYTEPFFIVVVMSLASTRPIVRLAERGIHSLAKFFGDTPTSWWLAILTIAPLIGSFITEAAAMTIATLLLKDKIYEHSPSKKLAYGTMGLMFVSFSVGGVLTNYATPPAITLSNCWGWTAGKFFTQFGWRVIVGLIIVNALYFFFLRRDLKALKPPKQKKQTEKRIPIWVTLAHLFFLVWTIVMAHYPPIFMGSYLFFLGFHQATRHHQYELNLRRPLMVGLFLAGLVIHAGFQEWWIEPLIGNLGYGAMMLAGAALTAVNENTTVAFLACLLDDLGPKVQYAITAGLVAGGGLTIMAHAPNPAGQALLRRYFRKGISPWNVFLAALIPTLIFLAIFYFFPPINS